MKKAEYPGNGGYPQRDSAEHEEYAGAQSADGRETEEADGADLLERILDRENLNRAYKRVKANKGAPGIDGMTVEDALPWLREHREELLDQIRNGKYKPQPVRRKEIPKPDCSCRRRSSSARRCDRPPGQGPRSCRSRPRRRRREPARPRRLPARQGAFPARPGWSL